MSACLYNAMIMGEREALSPLSQLLSTSPSRRLILRPHLLEPSTIGLLYRIFAPNHCCTTFSGQAFVPDLRRETCPGQASVLNLRRQTFFDQAFVLYLHLYPPPARPSLIGLHHHWLAFTKEPPTLNPVRDACPNCVKHWEYKF